MRFDFACLPNKGVGLARLEFIINRMIGVHPRALLEFDDQDAKLQNEIRAMMKGYDSPREFYVGRLTEGIATLGAAFYPKRVIVRLSDFKSNEYANLVGGERYEPEEENPMLGLPWRRSLRLRKLPRLLRARVRGGETRAQRDGAD